MLRSLGFNRDELVDQLFSLPLEFRFESLFSEGVSGGPDGFVVFDVIFDHGVKDSCDFVGSRGGGGPGTELSFHSAQIVAALKRQGTVVWYVMAKDEGRGFQKKANQDFEFYATVEFLQHYLSK